MRSCSCREVPRASEERCSGDGWCCGTDMDVAVVTTDREEDVNDSGSGIVDVVASDL